MKFPKYSILYFNHPLTQHQKELGQFLKEGKKVFWFGTESDVTYLKKAYKPFSDAFFLQAFIIPETDEAESFTPFTVIDGEGLNREYRPAI